MPLSALLTSSVTVQRQTINLNVGGVPTALPCRIQPAGWSAQRQFNPNNTIDLFEVYTQIDLAVAQQDRLVVDGVTYTVEAYRPQSPLPGVLAVFQTVVSKAT